MKFTPALHNIVAICYKWYADFNVIIAIVTTNSLFATNETNVVDGETLWSLHQFIGTFKVFCINAKKSENFKNNKMVQKVLKLVSTYLFWYFNK